MANVVAILFVINCFFGLLSASGNLVCYFTSWTVYRSGQGQYNVSNIDPHLCTHILYSFVGLHEDGTVAVLDDWEIDGLHEIKHLINLKRRAPKLKILLSMGGWNEGSEKYSQVARDPAKRTVMVQSVLDFVAKYRFDGFDLDWEYPCQRDGSDDDKQNFVTLLGELKTALNSRNLILSAAVAGAGESIDISYDVPRVSQNLDMINIMTYDFHGDWDNYVGHHSALYPSHFDEDEYQRSINVAGGIGHWIKRGADPSKINLGIGTYGRTFTLADPSQTGLYAPAYGAGEAGPYTEEAGMLGFNEICVFCKDWQYVWDDEQKVPHRYSGDQWVGYDDPKSIEYKIDYVKQMGLGGAMVWSLDTDDFLGVCGQGTYPIIRKIKQSLGN